MYTPMVTRTAREQAKSCIDTYLLILGLSPSRVNFQNLCQTGLSNVTSLGQILMRFRVPLRNLAVGEALHFGYYPTVRHASNRSNLFRLSRRPPFPGDLPQCGMGYSERCRRDDGSLAAVG